MRAANQVQQVRVRLLLSDIVAALQQRTRLDSAELTQVIDLCVEHYGLNADIEGRVEAFFQNWRREPRRTLVEHVRHALSETPRS